MIIKENLVVSAPEYFDFDHILKHPGVWKFENTDEYVIVPESFGGRIIQQEHCLYLTRDGRVFTPRYCEVYKYARSPNVINLKGNTFKVTNKEIPANLFPIKKRPSAAGLYIAYCNNPDVLYLVEIENGAIRRYARINKCTNTLESWCGLGDFTAYRPFNGTITYP